MRLSRSRISSVFNKVKESSVIESAILHEGKLKLIIGETHQKK